MSHPTRARIAEIVVRRQDGSSRRGSGYLVTGDRVLTAAHVVKDATAIGVWLGVPRGMDPTDRQVVDHASVIVFPAADLALLPVSPELVLGDQPPLLGALDRDGAGPVHVVAAGCPRFKLRPMPGRPDVQLREVYHALGRIEPGSNVKTGTLEFTVLDGVPPDLQPEQHSPWEGMSGAAVFAGSRIVGVVGQHELREAHGTLTIRPISSVMEEAADARRWWATMPRPTGAPEQLDTVTEPTERQLVAARAQRAASAVAPPLLVAREDELERLRAFAAGTDRFLWLEGPAFSGKTAVLAWFVLHPPDGIDIAACFLRRTTGDADAQYMVDVLARQLAAHADRPYTPAPHVSAQRDDLLDLADEAAATSAQRGRKLLLVIDGLDEDQTPEPGLEIATWLPGEGTLPANVKLIVASRTRAVVPLPPGHALRQHRAALAPSEAATELEIASGLELSAARRGGGLVYPLLGILAASVGDWTLDELTTALRAQGAEVLAVQVADALKSQLSRTVTANAADGDAVQIAFAHDALLDEARRLYASDLPQLHDALLDWCHGALLGAESDKPLLRYVDRHYVEQLAARGEWTPHWLDLLRPSWRAHRNASPSTYLPLRDDLRRLDAAARATGAPALVARIAAAAALAQTSGEIETTSPQLAAVLVGSGRWSTARALNYLARLENRDQRATAIAVVAPMLAPEPEVAELTKALYLGLGGPSDDERGWAAFGVASLFAAVGDTDTLWEFVRAQPQLGTSEAGNAAAGALAGLAGDDLARMLDLTVEHAAALSGFNLWRLAERLSNLDDGTRARVEAALGRSFGRFLLELLNVDQSNVQHVGEALELAAPFLAADEQRDEVQRAMTAAAGDWSESRVLASVAAAAPPELHDAIDDRSAHLAQDGGMAATDRRLVAVGLLARADEPRRRRLRAERGPTGSQFMSGDDAVEFIHRLAAGGLVAQALEDIRDWTAKESHPINAEAVAVMAPYLPPGLVPDALGLCEAIQQPWRRDARGAVYARALEVGRDDVLDIAAERWDDAEQMLHLALNPGVPPQLPEDPWLHAAATAQLGLRGDVALPQCADLLLASRGVLDLTEVAAILRTLPLAEQDAAAVHAASLPGDWLEKGRCMRDLLRATAARHGIDAVWRSAEGGDPQMQLYAMTACGAELDADNPRRLRRLADNHPEPALASTALLTSSDAPERWLDQLRTRLSPESLGEGHGFALRVLETLPPELRPVVLERLLDDDYLTARQGYVSEYEWAETRLGQLAHSLSMRQVDLVEGAVPERGMGSAPRAQLRAALARRRAALGDLNGFERTWGTISDSGLRVRTLLVALGRYPVACIPRWLDLAISFEPHVFATGRALLWSIAAQRFAELTSATATELATLWLDRAEYRQPGELFVDLSGLVSLLRVAAGPETVRELRDLLRVE